MGELCARMFLDINLKLPPGSVAVANILATGANRQKPAERFHGGERVLHLGNRILALAPGVFTLGDVAEIYGQTARPGRIHIQLEPALPRLEVVLELSHAAVKNRGAELRLQIPSKQLGEPIEN